MIQPWLVVAASAQDLGGDVGMDFDLGSQGELLTYSGSYSQTSEKLTETPKIRITHPGGTISVRCRDVETMTARIDYKVEGTEEGPMQSYGNGIRLSATGAAGVGRVNVVVPSRPSAVKTSAIGLVVNVPRNTTVDVDSSRDWVQVTGCGGTVVARAGANGAWVGGALQKFQVAAAAGDVTVELAEGHSFSEASAVTATKGAVKLTVATAQGADVNARGSSVTASLAVLGTTNTDTALIGQMGSGGPALKIVASGAVTISDH